MIAPVPDLPTPTCVFADTGNGGCGGPLTDGPNPYCWLHKGLVMQPAGLRVGDRVQIPTVEGPRNLPTYATVIGADPDNDGYTMVRTDFPVMGEYEHSIEDADVERNDAAAKAPTGLPPARVLADTLRGHEFLSAEIAAYVPDLYATEDTPTDDKIVHLHFFTASMDWYVAEVDDDLSLGFGYANLGNDQNAEWGYVDLIEMGDLVIEHANGLLQIVERDLNWLPKPFGQIEGTR